MISSIKSKEYRFRFVMILNFQQSTQNRRYSLIFIANNIDKKYKISLSVIKFLNRFFVKNFLILSNLYENIRYVQLCKTLTSIKSSIL